jgi:hypothetical protein
MDLEPGQAKNDRMVTEAGDVELDVLCMRPDLKLDRLGFLGDGAGRNGTTVNDLQVSG